MSVSKIFIVLGTVIVCVIVIAFVLNVLLPNVVNSMVTAVENTIYNATGFALDLNGDGTNGSTTQGQIDATADQDADDGLEQDGAGVEGFWGT